ncbi:MAG: hypothetical protein KY434_11065, partial [Actinobacteria bacterium]|nr:hypothetical protein [Actinomycetota bacterium]
MAEGSPRGVRPAVLAGATLVALVVGLALGVLLDRDGEPTGPTVEPTGTAVEEPTDTATTPATEVGDAAG